MGVRLGRAGTRTITSAELLFLEATRLAAHAAMPLPEHPISSAEMGVVTCWPPSLRPVPG
jgi:hypothetical protein